MTSELSSLFVENITSNSCCYYNEDKDATGRKRRRPQPNDPVHDLPKHGDSATRDKPRTIERHRRSALREHLVPVVLWVALLFACYQKDQHKYQIPQADAMKSPGITKRKTHLRQKRVLNLATTNLIKIDYLDLPETLWIREDSEDQFLQGNEVRVSPFDESILYATSKAGDLRVLSASNGMPLDRVRPAPRTITEGGTTSTWSLYSNSGMAFGTFRDAEDISTETHTNGDDDNGYNDYLQFLLNNGIEHDGKKEELDFLVYSVVDDAPSDSRFLPKTRVVCVSIPEHKILWMSAGLPGTPNGSPLVYYADDVGSAALSSLSSREANEEEVDNGMYIVLTHNSVLIRPDNTTRTTGHLTVLDSVTGHVKWTQSEWSRDEVPKGYGPPQVAHNPVRGGEYSGGSRDNKNDVVVWTSSDDEGRGRLGNIYSFQMKSSSDAEAELKNKNSNNEEDVTSYTYTPFQVFVLRKVRWNSIARPTMNQAGTNLYVGVTGNAVRGWNGVGKFNGTADWATRLVPFNSGTNASSLPYSEDVVIPTAPVLSADEERLFVVSARNETICLDAKDGSRMWSVTTRESSPLLGEPKASPDNKRLYMIMSGNGRVNGIDQTDGKILWSFGCDKKTLAAGECQDPPVSANFDLSSDGHVLYFGTADGRIVALNLGQRIDTKDNDLPISTGSSTITIGLDDDDGPLEFDENSIGTFDDELAKNEGKGTSVGKILGSIFAILLSLAVAAVSLMYVAKAKGYSSINWTNYRFPRSFGGEKRHSSVSRVRVRVQSQELDGPDKYEDRIIATLSEDEKSIEDEQFNTLWIDPTHSNPKPTRTNEDDIPTADRLAVMLGTSNKIAPISESFGYGQAVLL
ncbi:unnamed protein product [Pseudo-nitzschia multistriata]|uniref:Pyrrolo-quinoline quinone repeat domain-containing protein n=1 Tax=Pseudo-nitzschia multistriata TaxID=183589 RepID=A0A448Z0K5_9STRA|nr:unnamed protein product [Pseudo-nitzschia multistriata]